MRATWNGEVIAESDDTVVVEGNHYFPVDSLRTELLVDSGTTTSCAWKGTAHYWSIQVGDAVNTDAVWYYPEPKAGAEQVAGRAAFWRGVEVSS